MRCLRKMASLAAPDRYLSRTRVEAAWGLTAKCAGRARRRAPRPQLRPPKCRFGRASIAIRRPQSGQLGVTTMGDHNHSRDSGKRPPTEIEGPLLSGLTPLNSADRLAAGMRPQRKMGETPTPTPYSRDSGLAPDRRTAAEDPRRRGARRRRPQLQTARQRPRQPLAPIRRIL